MTRSPGISGRHQQVHHPFCAPAGTLISAWIVFAAAMIDLLRIRNDFWSDTDQETHAALTEAIADRDEAAAAMRSRSHLLSLKSTLE